MDKILPFREAPARKFRFAVVEADAWPLPDELDADGPDTGEPEKFRYCLKQYPVFPPEVLTLAHWLSELSRIVTVTFLPSTRTTCVLVPAPDRRFK